MARQKRYRVLPASGTAMISTDLHGNGEDFRSLRSLFLERRARDEASHWVLLGDLVHGPDEQARHDQPQLYDFPDESWEIVQGTTDLLQNHPDRVHLVLGNHDHAHVGGPRPAKFYADEAGHFEQGLTPAQLEAVRALFQRALVAILTHCGVLATHGAPGSVLDRLELLDDLSFDPEENDHERNAMLHSALTSYGQPEREVTAMLQALGASAGLELDVVIHGHDRELEGFFREGSHQLCPVLFGALREHKRYVEIDLGGRYRQVEDLREDVEIKRLYP